MINEEIKEFVTEKVIEERQFTQKWANNFINCKFKERQLNTLETCIYAIGSITVIVIIIILCMRVSNQIQMSHLSTLSIIISFVSIILSLRNMWYCRKI